MSTFQEKINSPVDIEGEIKAYEEGLAIKRGDVAIDDPQPPSGDDPGSAPEETASADPDPAHQDDDTPEPPKHQGNAWKTMRERVKKAEEEARSVREEMIRRDAEQRVWAEYHRAQQQQPQQAEQPIDPTVNPIEAIQRLEQQSRQMQEYIQQQQLISEVQRSYRADAERYKTQQPDFFDAYNHAVGCRVRQLELAGATPEQARQQTHREEMELAYSALQQNKSPAEVFYKYATQIYGYRPGGNVEQPRGPNGQFTSIEQEQKKAAAATTLSGAGKSPESRTAVKSPEHWVNTNGKSFDEAFDAWAATQGGSKKKIEWR